MAEFIEWAVAENILALDPDATCPTSSLYQTYLHFSEVKHRPAMSRQSFGRTLASLGSAPLKGTRGIRLHAGIRQVRD